MRKSVLHPLYLVRERELRHGKTDCNWAVELDFDPELDEEFGITVNKQQVSLSERTWQALMDNGLPSIIKNALRKSFKKAKDEEKAKTDSELPKQSEQVMAEAEKFAKERTPLPDSKKEQARKKVEEEAEKEAEETEKPKEEVEKKLLEEAQAKCYVILFESLEGAPFFRPEWFGPQKRIWINTRHRFFSEVYQATEPNSKARTALELMLCVLADSELHAPEHAEATLRGERLEWSSQLDLALRLHERGFGEELEAAEAAPA